MKKLVSLLLACAILIGCQSELVKRRETDPDFISAFETDVPLYGLIDGIVYRNFTLYKNEKVTLGTACDGKVYRVKIERLPYDPDIIHLAPITLTEKQRQFAHDFLCGG